MPFSVEDCLRQAKACQERAAKATTEVEKEHETYMASLWTGLASCNGQTNFKRKAKPAPVPSAA